MPTKLRNFSKLFCEYICSVNNYDNYRKIYQLYHDNSGLPRELIFREIIKEIPTKSCDPEILYKLFSDELSCLNKKELLNEKLFSDVLPFINKLLSEQNKCYISSSVPQDELDFIVNNILPLNITSKFNGIFGSRGDFNKGTGHLSCILHNENVFKKEIIVFGDDIADFDLSSEFGVDCIIIDRHTRTFPEYINRIESFREIYEKKY